MSSTVYFMNMRADFKENSFAKLQRMIDKLDIQTIVNPGEMTAIKLHFGEQGTFAYIHPVWIREVVRIIKGIGASPFLTDTSSLYAGGRSYAVSHIETAISHGFTHSCVNAPIIISDGLKGQDGVMVDIDKNHFKAVSIASGIYHADSMVVLSHFKGHVLSGFGGALKNTGMGCADKSGKYKMHLGAMPVIHEGCKGCRLCLTACPGNAITLKEKKPGINPAACLGCGQCFAFCPQRVFGIDWDSIQPNTVTERMVEFAYGALLNKQGVDPSPHPSPVRRGGKVCFINFLINITPGCDCLPFSDEYIVPDIGILASIDPVAIDQASVDLVNQQQGLHGCCRHVDKFSHIYPQINWQHQLEYAQEIGLGSREYELMRV